jgi:hypothetical protein
VTRELRAPRYESDEEVWADPRAQGILDAINITRASRFVGLPPLVPRTRTATAVIRERLLEKDHYQRQDAWWARKHQRDREPCRISDKVKL